MINRAVIAAQVAGGRRICWLVGNVLVGLESYVQDACFMTPRVTAKENIKQWHEGQRPRESHQSHVTSWTLSLSPPTFFFPIRSNPKPHPHHAVRSGLQQALWLVLIEIIAWYEAQPPLCLSSYSYHGVTGWHTHSTEILQGAECWECTMAFVYPKNFQVAGYGVLCFVNNHSYSRVASYLVWWISKNSMLVL